MDLCTKYHCYIITEHMQVASSMYSTTKMCGINVWHKILRCKNSMCVQSTTVHAFLHTCTHISWNCRHPHVYDPLAPCMEHLTFGWFVSLLILTVSFDGGIYISGGTK